MAGVGTTSDMLTLVRDTLEAGMSTSQEDEDWYIKTWHIRNPMALDVNSLPLGIVVSDGPSRREQYVGEDTQVFDITVYFFSTPVTNTTQIDDANIHTEAMIDRATDLLRVDPTLSGEVYDIQVVGSIPRQPGFMGNATYPGAELKCQAKRRRPWRID